MIGKLGFLLNITALGNAGFWLNLYEKFNCRFQPIANHEKRSAFPVLKKRPLSKSPEGVNFRQKQQSGIFTFTSA